MTLIGMYYLGVFSMFCVGFFISKKIYDNYIEDSAKKDRWIVIGTNKYRVTKVR